MNKKQINELKEIQSIVGKVASLTRNEGLKIVWKRLRNLITAVSAEATDATVKAAEAPAKRGLSAIRRLAQETT